MMKRHWKEPKNGTTCFFSEESYTRVLGSFSLHEQLARKFEDIQYGKTFTPLIPFEPPNNTDSKDKVGASKKAETKEATASAQTSQKQAETKLSSSIKTEDETCADKPENVASKKTGAGQQMLKSQKSTLNAKEQRRYLDLYHKYVISYCPQQPTPAEMKELTEFESLQLRVSQEQQAFRRYTELLSKSRHFEYNHIIPAARKYTSEKLSHQCHQVENYARYYVADQSLSLRVTSDRELALRHEKLLLELGSFPKVFMPDMSKQTEIPTQYDKINKRFPSNGRKTTNKKAWNHEVCSRDENCEVLAQRHACQLVTCGSALRRLVDNHAPSFNDEWEIPVVVRMYEHDNDDISSKQKVVYIDKPFASRTLNNREKNAIFYKYALKSFITQPAHTRGQRGQGGVAVKDNPAARPDSANPFDDEVNIEDLETFGSFDFDKPRKPKEVSAPIKSDDKGKAVVPGEKDIVQGSLQSRLESEGEPVEKNPASLTQVISKESMKASDGEIFSDISSDGPGEKTPLKLAKLRNSSKDTKETEIDIKSPKQTVCSSGGDSSQEENLVIDVPDLPSPPKRKTRSQSKLGSVKDVSSPDVVNKRSPRLTRQTSMKEGMSSSGERVVRKRKSVESRQSLESDSDTSPERRTTRTRSGQKSRTSSGKLKNDKEKKCESELGDGDLPKETEPQTDTEVTQSKSDVVPDLSALFSPSKVDNIMIKTAADDLSPSPVTSPVRVNRKVTPGSQVGVSPLDSILEMQERMLPTGHGRPDVAGHGSQHKMSEFRQPEDDNVTYNLWNFSGLTLLTRCSCHGVLRNVSHKAQPVCIVPKLEYQAKFGVEEVTQSEVARDWITCLVKPNTRLVRGRINALTSELLKVDDMDLGSVLRPSAFVPSVALASLHNLFLKLTELTPGQYILSHKKGDDSCQLLKNTDNKRGAYDLKFSYLGFFTPSTKKDEKSPWVPVDPTIVLPQHRRLGRVPCTFEPPDYHPRQKNRQKKGKGKGKRNVPKKKNSK